MYNSYLFGCGKKNQLNSSFLTIFGSWKSWVSRFLSDQHSWRTRISKKKIFFQNCRNMADESEFSTEFETCVGTSRVVAWRMYVIQFESKQGEEISDRERLASIVRKILWAGRGKRVKSLMKNSPSHWQERPRLERKRRIVREGMDKADRNSSDDASADHCDLKVVKRRLSHIGSKASITRRG